jgi:hypothetical protein
MNFPFKDDSGNSHSAGFHFDEKTKTLIPTTAMGRIVADRKIGRKEFRIGAGTFTLHPLYKELGWQPEPGQTIKAPPSARLEPSPAPTVREAKAADRQAAADTLDAKIEKLDDALRAKEISNEAYTQQLKAILEETD